MQHNIFHTVLNNGVTLVVVPMQGTDTITSIVYFAVGARHESDAQQGLAHFTEHMVFKGGVQYPNTQAIARTLDAVGGEFNAHTAEDHTAFYTETASMHLELGLSVLSDMTLKATFPADELEKEKGVIVEEINMYEDMPMRKIDTVLMRQIFGDTPLGRPILGQKATVTAFTREDFVEYHNQHFVGEQCTIAVAGNIPDPQAIVPIVEGYFGEMPKGARQQTQKAIYGEPSGRVLIEQRPSEQTHLMLAVEGYSINHPKRFALRLLKTILGGNMSSRLFVSVREEQGLCYYVRAGLDSMTDVGLLVASAGVDNNRLSAAVEAIMNELRKIKGGDITAEELDRAKKYTRGQLALSMESSDDVASYYGLQDLYEKSYISAEEELRLIEAVTMEEVNAVAQELFVADKLRLSVIGPHQDAPALESLLTL